MSKKDKKEKDVALPEFKGVRPKETEAIAHTVLTLSDEDAVLMFSRVKRYETSKIALRLNVSVRYKLAWLKSQIYDDLRLRVGIDGLGRMELTDIAKSRLAVQDDKTRLDKFRELFRR